MHNDLEAELISEQDQVRSWGGACCDIKRGKAQQLRMASGGTFQKVHAKELKYSIPGPQEESY